MLIYSRRLGGGAGASRCLRDVTAARFAEFLCCGQRGGDAEPAPLPGSCRGRAALRGPWVLAPLPRQEGCGDMGGGLQGAGSAPRGGDSFGGWVPNAPRCPDGAGDHGHPWGQQRSQRQHHGCRWHRAGGTPKAWGVPKTGGAPILLQPMGVAEPLSTCPPQCPLCSAGTPRSAAPRLPPAQPHGSGRDKKMPPKSGRVSPAPGGLGGIKLGFS